MFLIAFKEERKDRCSTVSYKVPTITTYFILRLMEYGEDFPNHEQLLTDEQLCV